MNPFLNVSSFKVYADGALGSRGACLLHPYTDRPEWKALAAHYEQQKDVHLRELFKGDPKRAEHFSLEAAGLYLDYSKHRITAQTLGLPLVTRDAAIREPGAVRVVW